MVDLGAVLRRERDDQAPVGESDVAGSSRVRRAVVGHAGRKMANGRGHGSASGNGGGRAEGGVTGLGEDRRNAVTDQPGS